MITYKLLNDKETGNAYGAIRSDGWSFVFDPANTDYQEYCRWLAEGNLPEPADQGEQQ